MGADGGAVDWGSEVVAGAASDAAGAGGGAGGAVVGSADVDEEETAGVVKVGLG